MGRDIGYLVITREYASALKVNIHAYTVMCVHFTIMTNSKHTHTRDITITFLSEVMYATNM